MGLGSADCLSSGTGYIEIAVFVPRRFQSRFSAQWNTFLMLVYCGYTPTWIELVFTARRSYARTVLGVVVLSVRLSVCPSVRPSVCHTHAL